MINSFWKNRRVFLTGHTGFKGAWLSLWLQELGANICGVALAPKTQPNLFSLAAVAQGMESHFVDVRDFELLRATLHHFQPEIIIHMAAQPLVRYSYQHPIETYSTNVMGTVHVLEAAKTCASVKAVVNVTTDKCYENKEWMWGYRENEALGGQDPYSSSKACSELITHAYRNSFYQSPHIGLASARAGNVIGGGDWSEDRLIVDVIKSILAKQAVVIRNPAAVRPWQHVLESLFGYLLLAEKLFSNPQKYSSAWNFGPNVVDAMCVEQIVKRIFSAWPEKNNDYVIQQNQQSLHEAHLLRLDTTKAAAELQWRPRLTIDSAIDWIVMWYIAWMKKDDMRAFTIHQIQKYQDLLI